MTWMECNLHTRGRITEGNLCIAYNSTDAGVCMVRHVIISQGDTGLVVKRLMEQQYREGDN